MDATLEGRTEVAVADRVDEVAAALRLRPDTPAYRRLSATLADVSAELDEIVELRACWTLTTDRFPSFPAGLQRCSHLALCAVTAGPVVSRRLTELYRDKQYFRAAIVDAVGTELLSAESDRVRDQVLAAVHDLGLHLTRRYSPGCPHMSMDCQADIVGHLPQASRIGVRLTRAGVLDPLKSMTFVLGAGDHLSGDQPPTFCDTCRETGCPRSARSRS